MKHDLKTNPEPFAALIAGRKRFELRIDDRGFSVGDTLALHEHDVFGGGYTGKSIEVRVTYIVRAPSFGLTGNLCVMSVE